MDGDDLYSQQLLLKAITDRMELIRAFGQQFAHEPLMRIFGLTARK